MVVVYANGNDSSRLSDKFLDMRGIVHNMFEDDNPWIRVHNTTCSIDEHGTKINKNQRRIT